MGGEVRVNRGSGEITIECAVGKKKEEWKVVASLHDSNIS